MLEIVRQVPISCDVGQLIKSEVGTVYDYDQLTLDLEVRVGG